MSRPPWVRIRAHPFAPDPDEVADHAGNRRCITCLMPAQHASHTLPAPDPDTRAITARMTGDRED